MVYRAQGSTAAPTTQMIKTVLEGVLQVERYTEGPSIDAVLVIVLLKVIVVLEDVSTRQHQIRPRYITVLVSLT